MKMADRKYGLNCLAAMTNPKCKVNSIRLINRTVCRNNCKEWNDNKCEFGYK